METLAKNVEKVSNYKKEWANTPLDKKLIKSFIIAFLLTISPALLFLGAMFLFAVVLYLPGWAYIMILCIIIAFRKLKKKVRESRSNP